MPNSNRITKLAVAIAGLLISSGTLLTQITVVDTGSLVSPVAGDPRTAVLSFDAGAASSFVEPKGLFLKSP